MPSLSSAASVRISMPQPSTYARNDSRAVPSTSSSSSETHQPAGHQIRARGNLTGSLVNRHRYHHQPVLAQMPAIPYDDILHIADALAVDEDLAGGNRFHAPCVLFRELDHVAVLHEKAVVGGDAHRARQLDMLAELTELAVQGYEIARTGELNHGLQLFLAGMPRHVDLRRALVADMGAPPVEVVDEVADGLFVSGDESRRQHHHVAGLYPDGPVLVEGHAVEHGKRLSLASGGEETKPVGGDVLPILVVRHDVRRQLEVTKVGGDSRVVDDAPSAEDQLAPEVGRQLRHLLDARDMGGERRHEDPSGTRAEDALEALSDGTLGRRATRVLNVRGVRQQQQDALVAVRREAVKVEALAGHGRVVDLEVARVDDDADGRLDGQGDTVDQAVGDGNTLDREGAHGKPLSRDDFHELGGLFEPVLPQLVAQEPQGQARAVHGNLETLQDVGQGPDVVLVGMGQDDGPGRLPLFLQIADIRDDQVDAQELGAGEHDAAVHRDHGVTPLQRQHVGAELSQPSQGNDPQGFHLGLASRHRREPFHLPVPAALAGGGMRPCQA